MEDPLIGHQLANFKIERLLGRGGMAQVYYGRDLKLQRPVAIKVIEDRFRDNPAYAQRFIQEARTVATWRHNHILQVYYADEEDGLYYFAMEYVDGLDVDRLLAQYKRDGELMPHGDILCIASAVAGALDYAHDRGVIHRDVKPSNIMVSHDGRVVLADFGLAMDVHEGSQGEIFGSPRYIAPEQARRSADALPQSDLYSLGVILYEMLTGVVPFDDPSPASLALQHMTMPPPSPRSVNPALNRECETVLLRALEKSPADRYQSGQALFSALERALLHPRQAPEAPWTSLPYRPISKTSLQDRVHRHLASHVTPQGSLALVAPLSSDIPSIDSEPLPFFQATRALRLLFGGTVLVLGLVAMAGVLAVFLRSLMADDPPGPRYSTLASPPSPPSAEAMGAALPTTSPWSTSVPATDEAPATSLSSTNTPIPLPSPFPSETAAQPSATATIGPTVTSQPSSTSQPTPPAPPPDGYLIHLYFDETSFYVWNPGQKRIAIRPIAFEALDSAGQSTAYRFDGPRWTQFYYFLEAGKCNRIEAARAPSYLRPSQCRGYNATVTPQVSSLLAFWLPRSGVSQFRVLWEGQELSRCQIEAGSCEVFLPV